MAAYAPSTRNAYPTNTVLTRPEVHRARKNEGIVIIAIVLVGLVLTGLVLAAIVNKSPPTSTTPGTDLGSNSNNPPELLRFRPVTATDRAISKPAFTIMVPQGWTGRASVERYLSPFGGADFNFTAQDSTGRMKIFFRTTDSPNYLEPGSWMTGQNCVAYDASSPYAYTPVQCREGSWWLPLDYIGMSAFIHSYMTAPDYIRAVSDGRISLVSLNGNPGSILNRVLWPIFKGVHPDVRIESIVDNPGLARRAITVSATETSGAQALFSYTENGEQYKYALQVLVVRYSTNVGNLYLSSWYTYAWGYSAPAKDFTSTGKIYSMIIPTVKVNPQWLQSEIQRLGQASLLLAQHNEKMIQMDYAMFRELEQSQFTTGQGWLDALGGVKQIVNPQNPQDSYRVPVDYRYYWYCGGLNEPIVGTNDSLYNPSSCTRYVDKTS